MSGLTKRKEKDRVGTYYASFDGQIKNWNSYILRTMTTGKKKGWWNIIQTEAQEDASEEEMLKRDAAGFYFAHTLVDEDVAPFALHHKGNAHKILQTLYKEYDLREIDDVQHLYESLTKWLTTGLERQRPSLWFIEIDRLEEEIVKAHGRPKDASEMLVCVRQTIQHHELYSKVWNNWQFDKEKTLDDYHEAMRTTWKYEVGAKAGKADEAYTVVDSGSKSGRKGFQGGKKSYKPFKGNCHGCGKQGHKKVDCRSTAAPATGQELRRCHGCNEVGHLRRDCPSRNQGRSENVAQFVGVTELVSYKPPVPPKGKSFQWADWCEDSDSDSDEEAEDDADDAEYVHVCMVVADNRPEVIDLCDSDSEEGSMPDLLRRYEDDSSMDSDATTSTLDSTWNEIDGNDGDEGEIECDDGGDDDSSVVTSGREDNDPDAMVPSSEVITIANPEEYSLDVRDGYYYTRRMDAERCFMLQHNGSDEEEEEGGNEFGRCTGCDELGPVGLYCTSCEDQGHVYYPENSDVEDRAPPVQPVGEHLRYAEMTNGDIGFCHHCTDIGPYDTPCIRCYEDELLPRGNFYDDVEMTVGVNEGWCANCREVGVVGTICDCTHGIYARVPGDNRVAEVNSLRMTASNLPSTPSPADAAAWLLDSGSTTHVTNNLGVLRDVYDCEQDVVVGTGMRATAKKKGWARIPLEGGYMMVLHGVLFVPGFTTNIISISKLCSNGTEIVWSQKHITLRNRGKECRVDKRRNGMAYIGGASEPSLEEAMVAEVSARPTRMDVNHAHKVFGHASEAITIATMKYWGAKPTGLFGSCTACLEAKAKQARIPKTATKSTVNGERLLLDTTGPYAPSSQGSIYDVYIVDQCSNRSWIYNVKKKSEVPKCLQETLRWCKGKGYKTEFLRCDNAGEHQAKLKAVCDEYGVTIEYTAPNTPQQNGQVERMIAVDRGRRNAMLMASPFNEADRKLLRAEATQTARFLANMQLTESRPIPPATALPDGTRFWKPAMLRSFGEFGYVTTRKKIYNKMETRAAKMHFVGYALNHAPGTYRMWSPITRTVILSRDVTWVAAVTPPPAHPGSRPVSQPSLIEDDDSDDDADSGNALPVAPTGRNDDEEMDVDETRSTPVTVGVRTRSRGGGGATLNAATAQGTRVGRELARLADFNAEFKGQNDDASDDDVDMAMSVLETKSDPDEPRTLEEALRGEHAEQWRKSIRDEMDNFLKRGAWVKVDRQEVIKKGGRPLGTKTVFKIKNEQDGSLRFKTREVTKGYNMKPGVHFEDSFSPVATDASTRLIIAISLYVINLDGKRNKQDKYVQCHLKHPERGVRFGSFIGEERVRDETVWSRIATSMKDDYWTIEVYDVEAAFLNAEPGVELHIEVPKPMILLGMVTREEAERILYRLTRSMYGNVDAALRFFLKYKEILIKMGLKQMKTDPCVFYSEDENGKIVLILGSHVDDTIIGGWKSEIDKFMDEFETYLKIDRLGRLIKHLGVWYEWCIDDNDEIFLKASMEKMRKDIVTKYEKATGMEARRYQSPGAPGSVLNKNEGEPIKLTEFRSILGSLLYFMTKIGPCLSNSTRELSSHMSNPDQVHWDAMGRVVGFLKSFDKFALVYRAPEELRGISISDATYASDPESRVSITGGINTYGGMLIETTSKKQSIVTLSSAEAELVAYTNRCQSVLFIRHFHEELFGSCPPSVIFEDNQGCIYLVKNQKVGGRTKHIQVRNLFVRDLYADRSVIPAFCRSEECIADMCTKNQVEKLFCEHARVIMNGLLPYRREDVKIAIRSIESKMTESSQTTE